MIKKRTRPQTRIRETTPDASEKESQATPQQGSADEEEDITLPVSELLELRKLRRSRQGIDVQKLCKGVARRRQKKQDGENEEEDEHEDDEKNGHQDMGGLRGSKLTEEDGDAHAKARRAVRTNNFTQQTNAVDVNKHMMAYIEENLRVRSRPPEDHPGGLHAKDGDNTQDQNIALSDRWKIEKRAADEGSVTSSLAMLTAIPEVDLGMDARLKNIEETEKAKRQVADERRERRERKPTDNNDEEHLVATRFYRPHIKQKSDAEIMRNAKLEAMGLAPTEERTRRQDRPQMATDEVVMERFKKRMRR